MRPAADRPLGAWPRGIAGRESHAGLVGSRRPSCPREHLRMSDQRLTAMPTSVSSCHSRPAAAELLINGVRAKRPVESSSSVSCTRQRPSPRPCLPTLNQLAPGASKRASPNSQAFAARAITDEASPFALRSTRIIPRRASGVPLRLSCPSTLQRSDCRQASPTRRSLPMARSRPARTVSCLRRSLSVFCSTVTA
jgi:hypothetical protein